jgi:hypothetical protein
MRKKADSLCVVLVLSTAKPAEGRKRLQLKPRSKPLDAPVETTAARSAAIFGGGRPHDDLEYEVSARRRRGELLHIGFDLVF